MFAVFDPGNTVAKGLQVGLSSFLADSMCLVLGCQEAAGSLTFEKSHAGGSYIDLTFQFHCSKAASAICQALGGKDRSCAAHVTCMCWLKIPLASYGHIPLALLSNGQGYLMCCQ